MDTTNSNNSPVQNVFYGVLGLWIVSLTALLFFSIKGEGGVAGALMLSAMSSGILSSYLLNYASVKRQGKSVKIFFLVLNAILTAVAFYVLVGLMV